jgi:fructuronate reductase
VRRQSRDGVVLVDPLADVLGGIGRACTGVAAEDVAAFLALDSVFGTLRTDAGFRAALRQAYTALGDGSPAAVSRALA